ncbi:unnamed protein product [Linum trigynum]|uniref:Uncharacterized protein n=1 Tax=Linum trigynum TaxID=586398 RepID=A0AAV2D9U2_9ROSI
MQVVRKSKRQTRKPTPNQAQYQGNNSRKVQGEVAVSGATKGKGKIDLGKANPDSKGKQEQKKGSGLSKLANIKGKGEEESKSSNGNNTAGQAQEWRKVGPKSSSLASTSGNNEPKVSNIKPTALVSPQLVAQSLPVVVDLNNTKIQILPVPDLILQQKENQNPNLDGSTSRKHGHKQACSLKELISKPQKGLSEFTALERKISI